MTGRIACGARAIAAIISGMLLHGAEPAQAAPSSAADILRTAIDAQGGSEALRAISSLQWTAHGYRNMLEQSERPEGPYIPEFDTVTEIHDQTGGRLRSLTKATIYPEFQFSSGVLADSSAAVRLSDEGASPANADAVKAAREILALSPERLLLTAASAADLRRESRAILQSVPQDVLAFSYDGAPARLYLNAHTHLPTALDYSGPAARPDYWRFLGDVSMRTYFSFWWLGRGGVRMPMQSDIYRNGLHDSSYVIESLTINPALNDTDLQISPSLRAAYIKSVSSQATPTLRAGVDVAPGVTLIPGAWNVLLVRQDDGIVVIEAPISSAYSELILAEARRRFEGLRVKAVVSTSDAWPHIAGVRAYIAHGIPVYCLDLNRAILMRVAKARYRSHPDTLEEAPRAPHFVSVGKQTAIGDGPNQIKLFPIAGETSERQMMAYLPNIGLLYGSDPFQQTQDGSYQSLQAATELIDAVGREQLQPRTFLMMHVSPTPWTALMKAVETTRPTFPAGLDKH